MSESFCIIEKDSKTYRILNIYLNSNRNLTIEDNILQRDEMEQHNKNCGKNECIGWIEENGKKFRAYLNTIKILSVIFRCNNIELNWKNFCDVVDKYNESRYFIDNIF